jgi:hypothetical protein
MSLASIVTPTVPSRMSLLLDRCIPSVRALDWPDVQHVIVSDRNRGLAERLAGEPGILFVELNESWRDGTNDASCGAFPWMIGSRLALGEFVGFLGDDDEVRPEHVARHVAAMEAAEAMWSVSRVQFVVRGQPWQVIGDPSFAHGQMDSDGIMCRAEALRTATWNPVAWPEDGFHVMNAGDFRLVREWRARGLPGVFVDGEPTVVHHDGWAA